MHRRDTVILHLSLIAGVGPRTVVRLIDQIGAERLHELYDMGQPAIQKCGVSEKIAKAIVDGLADQSLLNREQALIANHDIHCITYVHHAYPEILRQSYAPPIVLYTYGAHPDIFDPGVAVIGSRDANHYGRDVMHRIIPDLVAYGCSIISGGARGADAMAHEIALDQGGKTCAILGSGILEPYPRTNRKLFKRIVDAGGALISPFPLQAKAQPAHFPVRNRIISGLSRAVVVAQAREKSGTRITAQYALEQGREVGAVPGAVTDQLSSGCHALMREGAHVITSGVDVLHACGIELSHDVHTQVQPREKESEQNPLMQFCREPRMFDDIVEHMDYSYDEVQAQLFALQMDGKLEQDFTGRWVMCR